MTKEINCEEILKKQLDIQYPHFKFLEGDDIPYDIVLDAMREACKQTVNECTERAQVDRYRTWTVNKESILNVKNSIK